MAQIGYLDVPSELVDLLKALISPTSNRRTGSVRRAGYLPSRQQKLKLTTRSLLPQIAALWAALPPETQLQWKAAGAAQSTNGWNLFVQDMAYRLKYGIEGLATPSTLHQYKVGRVEINAPAETAVLLQYHPETYYVSKKLRGSTTIREDVAIHETLSLPLLVGLSYRSSLVPTRENYQARFYATIKSSYQGRTYETEVGFSFNLTSGWTRTTAQATSVIGTPRSYTLSIHLDGVRGWLEWDNTLALHSGSNFARDRRCNDVNNELTTVNYMIEKSWEEQTLPHGAAFDSVYPAD